MLNQLRLVELLKAANGTKTSHRQTIGFIECIKWISVVLRFLSSTRNGSCDEKFYKKNLNSRKYIKFTASSLRFRSGFACFVSSAVVRSQVQSGRKLRQSFPVILLPLFNGNFSCSHAISLVLSKTAQFNWLYEGRIIVVRCGYELIELAAAGGINHRGFA